LADITVHVNKESMQSCGRHVARCSVVPWALYALSAHS